MHCNIYIYKTFRVCILSVTSIWMFFTTFTTSVSMSTNIQVSISECYWFAQVSLLDWDSFRCGYLEFKGSSLGWKVNEGCLHTMIPPPKWSPSFQWGVFNGLHRFGSDNMTIWIKYWLVLIPSLELSTLLKPFYFDPLFPVNGCSVPGTANPSSQF